MKPRYFKHVRIALLVMIVALVAVFFYVYMVGDKRVPQLKLEVVEFQKRNELWTLIADGSSTGNGNVFYARMKAGDHKKVTNSYVSFEDGEYTLRSGDVSTDSGALVFEKIYQLRLVLENTGPYKVALTGKWTEISHDISFEVSDIPYSVEARYSDYLLLNPGDAVEFLTVIPYGIAGFSIEVLAFSLSEDCVQLLTGGTGTQQSGFTLNRHECAQEQGFLLSGDISLPAHEVLPRSVEVELTVESQF